MTTRRSRSRAAFRPELGPLEARTLLNGRVDAPRPAAAVIHAKAVAAPRLPAGYTIKAFNPPGQPPAGGWPVVIALEGNGGHRTSSTTYAGLVAAQLRPAGIAVVGLSYPDQRWPRTFDNGILRAVAAVVGSKAYNRDRLGLIGESFGATTALMVGLRNPAGGAGARWTVRAVGEYYGVTDYNQEYRDLVATSADPASGQVLRGEILPYVGRFNAATYASASPTSQATPGDPAVFIASGSLERFGTAQTDRLIPALAAAGIAYEYHLMPGCTHGFGPNGEPGRSPGQACPGGTSMGLGASLRSFFAARL